jgi:hypothetical protein
MKDLPSMAVPPLPLGNPAEEVTSPAQEGLPLEVCKFDWSKLSKWASAQHASNNMPAVNASGIHLQGNPGVVNQEEQAITKAESEDGQQIPVAHPLGGLEHEVAQSINSASRHNTPSSDTAENMDGVAPVKYNKVSKDRDYLSFPYDE